MLKHSINNIFINIMELDNQQKYIFDEISKNKIFLYCTPKCGGSSLLDSLKKYYNTIHIHSQFFFEKFHKDRKIINNKFKIIDCIEESRKNNDEIFIIDVYRRPIERNMSYFFHIIDEILPNYFEKTTDELIEFFNKNMYFQYYQSIDEVANHYKINLYDKPFDHSKMYLEYKFNNINFIILHFDYIDKWENILQNIFDTKIELLDRNIGEKKTYANVYKYYKNNYNIPNFILDFIEKEKNFNFFNNEEMKINYINYWKDRIDNKLKLNDLPDDFNTNNYKEKNSDLKRMNELELMWHYRLFGIKEKRTY